MNADDFVKVLLAIAVAFAIVLLAWGLFRILNNLANSISDIRQAIKNTSTLSDYILEDYLKARTEIYGLVSSVKSFKSSFVDPVTNLGKAASMVAPFVKRRSKNTQNED